MDYRVVLQILFNDVNKFNATYFDSIMNIFVKYAAGKFYVKASKEEKYQLLRVSTDIKESKESFFQQKEPIP